MMQTADILEKRKNRILKAVSFDNPDNARLENVRAMVRAAMESA